MNESIEMYLMQVARQLRGLPLKQREAELREIESHLRAMIEAREVDGVLYSEAVEESLRQFGSPQRVGRDLIRSWRKNQQESLARSFMAGLVAVACQVGIVAATSSVQLPILRDAIENGDDLLAVASLIQLTFWGVSCGVAPFVAGYLANRIAPRRGWRAFYVTHILLLGSWFFYRAHGPDLANRMIVTLVEQSPALFFGTWLSARTRATTQEAEPILV